MHTLLDLRGKIVTFIHISASKLHEVNIPDELLPEPGAIYVIGCGFTDLARLHQSAYAGDSFVIRAKSNLKAQERNSHAIDRTSGILCDQPGMLTGFYPRQDFPAPLRRIRFKDSQTQNTLIFLTHHFTLTALTITQFYRRRWQIELFFKWIKQHQRIKVFFGTSVNVVKTRIWIAVSAYALVAVVKNRLNLRPNSTNIYRPCA